jgi:hypothetical protein
MAIREATTSATEPAAGPRPDRRRRRRDLRAGPFPTAAMEQWQDTEAALAQLYRYAEGRAIDAVDWCRVRPQRRPDRRPQAGPEPPGPAARGALERRLLGSVPLHGTAEP